MITKPRTRVFCVHCGERKRSSPWSSYCQECRNEAERVRRERAKNNQRDPEPGGYAINAPGEWE